MALGVARGPKCPLRGAGRIAGRVQMHRELPGQFVQAIRFGVLDRPGHGAVQLGAIASQDRAVRGLLDERMPEGETVATLVQLRADEPGDLQRA